MATSPPSGQDGSDRDHDLGDAVTEERPGIERPVTPVPHSVFSVSNVAPKDRFGVWKESISCIFDVEPDRGLEPEEFLATVEASLFGELMLARTTSVRQSWARSPLTIARDGMDHYMIQLFVEGEMEAEHKRGSTSVQGKSLVVFDLSQEVSSRTSNFTNLSLIVPRDALAGLLMSPDEQHMRTVSAQNPVVALLIDHMIGLERMKACISAAQARDLASATTALVAACLNDSGTGAPSGIQGPSVPQMMVVRRMIEQHLDDPGLSVDRIAQMAGISRTRLYSLFEPTGGVNAYVRERRLRGAFSALLDTRKRHRPIYDIAAECGFSNESAFSRAFRRRFGCSPREARHDLVIPHGRRGGADSRRYEYWLHQLSA
jgi:AraC-like DNA-binding protein